MLPNWQWTGKSLEPEDGAVLRGLPVELHSCAVFGPIPLQSVLLVAMLPHILGRLPLMAVHSSSSPRSHRCAAGLIAHRGRWCAEDRSSPPQAMTHNSTFTTGSHIHVAHAHHTHSSDSQHLFCLLYCFRNIITKIKSTEKVQSKKNSLFILHTNNNP